MIYLPMYTSTIYVDYIIWSRLIAIKKTTPACRHTKMCQGIDSYGDKFPTCVQTTAQPSDQSHTHIPSTHQLRICLKMTMTTTPGVRILVINPNTSTHMTEALRPVLEDLRMPSVSPSSLFYFCTACRTPLLHSLPFEL